MVQISPRNEDAKKLGIIKKPLYLRKQRSFVEICLKEDLYINLRCTKEAELSDCECNITALKEKAKSINHAYALISRHYETHRRSYGGNVFDRVYY
ncbi:hypothetical protein [Desulfonema magnum]|uniref:Uncharacterized protein n=1 Tax=Desulfonema magnum TaxID=45655 RepID=A0A975GP22_9BACT|nr:hypothetical protein [Desulfonema magnum]QTA88377.1 Uncharacterized protein dnm_044220 [Desulfonema magnum]